MKGNFSLKNKYNLYNLLFKPINRHLLLFLLIILKIFLIYIYIFFRISSLNLRAFPPIVTLSISVLFLIIGAIRTSFYIYI